MDDINTVLNRAENVTYILNVKINNEKDTNTRNMIRQAIYQKIANKAITQIVEGIDVSIKWIPFASKKSAYYADIRLFNDVAVSQHTKQLRNTVLHAIDDEFSNTFTHGITELVFFVSRPLRTENAILD